MQRLVLASDASALCDTIDAMHPSFGVPWPRLQRAAARLAELHTTPDQGRVHSLLFLCGLKYLLSYRQANGRRLSHYIDDGLREAVEEALPALMRHCANIPSPRQRAGRVQGRETNAEFQQLISGFHQLHRHFPASTAKWVGSGTRENNLVRLAFGMGVIARFAPESYLFVRKMLARPLTLSTAHIDVLESFHWHPDWSLMLAA